jgi:hypothetical protein
MLECSMKSTALRAAGIRELQGEGVRSQSDRAALSRVLAALESGDMLMVAPGLVVWHAAHVTS